MAEIVCRELTAAWQPVGLSFNFERRQMQTQVARIMSVNEKTLCLSFEIRMPHSSGLLNLAFPAVVANTILRRLTSDWGRRRRHAPETRTRMESLGRPNPIWRRAAAAAGAIARPALVRDLQPGTVIPLGLPAKPCRMAGGRAGFVARPSSPARRTSRGADRSRMERRKP